MASQWQIGGEPGRGWLVVLAGGVQADQGVEVDHFPGLVLSDLDVADPDQGAQPLLGEPGQAGQVAGQVGGEPVPQVARAGVELHGGLVVVAVRAQRPAEPGVVLAVPDRAGDVAAVRTAAHLVVAAGTARQDGLAVQAAGVDRAERRGGEGGEQARVRGDGLGHTFAAGQPGADQLAGVTLVHRGARRADGLAAVPAGDVQDPARFVGGGVVAGRSSPVLSGARDSDVERL